MYFGVWPISLKFITKNHTGPCKQGSTHELADNAESLQVPKTQAGKKLYSINSARLLF